jgi:hypothetical protein
MQRHRSLPPGDDAVERLITKVGRRRSAERQCHVAERNPIASCHLDIDGRSGETGHTPVGGHRGGAVDPEPVCEARDITVGEGHVVGMCGPRRVVVVLIGILLFGRVRSGSYTPPDLSEVDFRSV